MTQKAKSANFTNVELLTAMAKSEDPIERMKAANALLENPELITKVKTELLEKLANDTDYAIRFKICNDRPIFKLLSQATIIKRINDEEFMVRQMVLSKEEATEKLSTIQLARIATKLISEYETDASMLRLPIYSMLHNANVRARLSKDLIRRLENAIDYENLNILANDDQSFEGEFANLRKTLEGSKRKGKAN